MVYYAQAHLPISFGTFVVRTKGIAAEGLSGDLMAAIQEVKPDQPVTEVRTMDDWIGRSTARLRLQAGLLGAFALIAVVLAVIGVYGVMAYSVKQCTHELGVRLALGAEPGRLRRSATLDGMKLAAVGLAIGTVGAAASSRVLEAVLYQIKPGDPLTLAGAVALLAGACWLASYLPARRVTRVDPMIALRGGR